jgi:hypothetical protein
MSDLGSKKISSNYQRLLQKNESGFVADGSGSLITLNVSGSEYYTSGSTPVLLALSVTGSIVPEGSGSWDLGGPDNPFRTLYITENSLVFVETGGSATQTSLTKEDIYAWQTGDFSTRRDATTKSRLVSPLASTIRTAGVEPFVWDENDDLVSNNLTSLHIVSDKFWTWNPGNTPADTGELETRSIMFRYEAGDSPTNDLVIGG